MLSLKHIFCIKAYKNVTKQINVVLKTFLVFHLTLFSEKNNLIKQTSFPNYAVKLKTNNFAIFSNLNRIDNKLLKCT